MNSADWFTLGVAFGLAIPGLIWVYDIITD